MVTSKPQGKPLCRITVNSMPPVCSSGSISKMSDSISRIEADSVEKDEFIMNHRFSSSFAKALIIVRNLAWSFPKVRSNSTVIFILLFP